MEFKDEINRAIAAHGMWKEKLKGAIASGKTDLPVPIIRQDNQCAFGKWLYGVEIPAAAKGSPHYKKVRELHASFHQAAARVVELALAGKQKDAEALMSLTGEFASASSKLTREMVEWLKGA